MALPLTSREVRWFFAGESEPKELMEWIGRADLVDDAHGIGGRGGMQPDRTDVYLVVPDAVDLSIKWREGQLQIKGRCEELGPHLFAGGTVGVVERWIKWSYSGPRIDQAIPALFTLAGDVSQVRVELKKARAIRKFAFDYAGRATEVDSEAKIDQGVTIELTEIELTNGRYVSVAFDAFPDEANVAAAFLRAANSALCKLPASILREADSRAYPAWLASLVDAGSPPDSQQHREKEHEHA